MRKIATTILAIIFFAIMGEAKSVNTMNNVEPGFECGVSGAFTGTTNGLIIQAGGCNFPEDQLGPKSQKKFYKGIYTIKETNTGYETDMIGELPHEWAYGATVSTPDGMVLIGGNDATQNYHDVYRLTVNKDNVAELSALPSLPVFMDNFAAAYSNGKIYAGGGNVNGQPSNAVYVLDTTKCCGNWEELPSFPGNPRVQPVMAITTDKNGDETLYLWGGFAGKGEGREATLNTDGLKFNLKSREWEPVEGPKTFKGEDISLGGGAVTQLSNGKVVATGGVNKDIFLEALRNQAPDYLLHPISWYRFNPFILVFDPETETWEVKGSTSGSARAGAGMVTDSNNDIWVLGGELKPRIRTAEIFIIKNN